MPADRSFRLSSFVLPLSALLAAVACAGPGSPLGTDGTASDGAAEGFSAASGTPTCVALRAGSRTVGQVCVTEQAGEIRVQYTTTGGWRLRSTAAARADAPSGFPMRNGVGDVSRYPARASHSNATSYTARVSLAGSSSDPGDTIYISAWAQVRNGGSKADAWATPSSGWYFAFVRPAPPPAEGGGDGSGGGLAFLVVGSVASPTTSERMILTRLANKGYDARLMDQDDFSPAAVAGCTVVLIAHSVDDAIGKQPKPLTCGLMVSDDNSQGWHFQAFIDNDAYFDLAYWHRTDTLMYVIPEAPAELRAGLSGIVEVYTAPGEISWAPQADLPANAVRVARSRNSSYNFSIYYYERGQPLADGTITPGRRIFFGIHRDTFRLLTPQGLALWDAALEWASN